MLSNLLKRFKNDRRGNFAIITAVAFPAVFAGVGLAVDVANQLRLRTDLQNANDTGVLFATRYYQVNNRLPANSTVLEFVQANFPGTTVSAAKLVFQRQDNKMTLTSNADFKPMLMGYFGIKTSGLEAVSQASLGVNGALEFSLALDTTESMLDDDRIGGLKKAATNFVNILFDMKDRGADVKGAIVPFARYVNVGIARRNEPWLQVPRDIDTRKTERVCRTERPVTGRINCRDVFTPASIVTIPATPESCRNVDGFERCTPGRPARTEKGDARTDRVCDPVYGAAVTTCKNETSGRLRTWQGCVSSRAFPLNVADAYDGNKFPGVIVDKCASELQTLTSSRTVLNSKIKGLTTFDNTYIPEGIMWGMRTLTQAQPFDDGRPTTGNARPVRKALVVMTDGKNTLSPVTPRNAPSANGIIHDGNDEALANRYTDQSCAAAKTAGIEVYTISFGNQVPKIVRSLLETCATTPQLYFHASDAAALNDAFNKIADELLSIRLTQ